MAYFRRYSYTITTALATAAGIEIGDVTYSTTDTMNGFVNQIHFRATDMAATGDVTITVAGTSVVLWTLANSASTVQTILPRHVTETAAGVDVTYTTSDKVYDKFALADDRLTIAVSSGGSAKSMTIDLYVGG